MYRRTTAGKLARPQCLVATHRNRPRECNMNRLIPARAAASLICMVCLIAGLGIATSPAAAQPVSSTGADADVGVGEVLFDRWFVVQLQGQPAGWMHSRTTRTGAVVQSHEQMKLVVRRGESTQETRVDTRFRETVTGDPLSTSIELNVSAVAMSTRIRFLRDQMLVETEQFGRVSQEKQPLPDKPWLTPMASQRYLEKRIAAGDDAIDMRSFDPMSRRLITLTMTRQDESEVQVLGKVRPAIAWEVRKSDAPNIAMTMYTDEVGQMLRTQIELLPGMTLTLIEADESLATAEVNPPEVLAKTFVQVEGELPRPRETTSAIYELRIKPDDKGQSIETDLPRTGSQRVVWGDRQTARIAVDLTTPVNPMADTPKAAHLNRSAMIDSDDEQIVALRAQALGEDDAPAQRPARAEALRQFVHQYIDQKDLSVGFASASETARTAQGDCTEHAVLLAALLRADGVPSRVVSGVVYVDEFLGHTGVFGYHMWTQAWLGEDTQAGGRWVDLDATLNRLTPYDAAHIALAVSPMEDAAGFNDFMSMAPLIGRLSIRVIDVGHAE